MAHGPIDPDGYTYHSDADPAPDERTRMTARYLIWSIEHTAWWRPAQVGYTRDLPEAGRYSESEAREILARANTVEINECLVPLECAQTEPLALLAAIHASAELTDDDKELLQVIDLAAAVQKSALPSLVGDYYHDLGRANRTPRALLYWHIGLLVGVRTTAGS